VNLRRALLTATLLVLAGCGSGHRANADRPPAAVNVTAAIHPGRVELSPKRIGGGPVVLYVANLSSRPRRLTLETGTRGPGIRRTTNLIAPQGTAQLSVDVTRGVYVVSAGHGLSARLRVGAQRSSSQNDLLQP
jgi:hypothetical protein